MSLFLVVCFSYCVTQFPCFGTYFSIWLFAARSVYVSYELLFACLYFIYIFSSQSLHFPLGDQPLVASNPWKTIVRRICRNHRYRRLLPTWPWNDNRHCVYKSNRLRLNVFNFHRIWKVCWIQTTLFSTGTRQLRDNNVYWEKCHARSLPGCYPYNW